MWNILLSLEAREVNETEIFVMADLRPVIHSFLETISNSELLPQPLMSCLSKLMLDDAQVILRAISNTLVINR